MTLTQEHDAAVWNNLWQPNFTNPVDEWYRLRELWLAKRESRPHQPSLRGRSHVKGSANATGTVLKKSFVKSMSMETQHFQRSR